MVLGAEVDDVGTPLVEAATPGVAVADGWESAEVPAELVAAKV